MHKIAVFRSRGLVPCLMDLTISLHKRQGRVAVYHNHLERLRLTLEIIAILGSKKVMLYLSQELSAINELLCSLLIGSTPGHRA